ncbi:rhomboid family intramembrane serine protease [Candidatus Woesearchaeota archaeon]|nr:rhomboid family intramembrane serine protease [Candidatus Woesearchaeota archaeon]
MKGIESESKFVWKQFFFIITLPILLVQVIFGRKKASELLRPLKDFFRFIFEPKITITLIMINIFVFILEIFYFTQEKLMSFVFTPADLFSFNLYPIVASWFLHASVAHLAGNMLFLFIFGRIVEKDFGPKMLLIYFGAAIISDIVSAFFGQGGIGASGAIAGLISTAILMHPFYLTYLIIGIPIPIVLLGWLAILSDITGVLIPKNDNIGHFAHIGGYIATFLLVSVFNKKQKEKMRVGKAVNVIFIISLLVVWYLFLR